MLPSSSIQKVECLRKVQDNGLCGAFLLVALLSGTRGLRKKRRGAVKITRVIDQASRVTRAPIRESIADMRNGHATPAADFPAQIVP